MGYRTRSERESDVYYDPSELNHQVFVRSPTHHSEVHLGKNFVGHYRTSSPTTQMNHIVPAPSITEYENDSVYYEPPPEVRSPQSLADRANLQFSQTEPIYELPPPPQLPAEQRRRPSSPPRCYQAKKNMSPEIIRREAGLIQFLTKL